MSKAARHKSYKKSLEYFKNDTRKRGVPLCYIIFYKYRRKELDLFDPRYDGKYSAFWTFGMSSKDSYNLRLTILLLLIEMTKPIRK